MPKLIRDKEATMTASLEDLNYTYRELRGDKKHPGFKDIAAARVQVQMAIMAAQDAVGKLGVPQNTEPVAKTVKELGRNPYKEGTMSHKLYEEIAEQEPIKPRERGADTPKKTTINKVKATFAGTSRPQEGSVRTNVLKFIQCAPDNTATVEEMEKHFGHPVRGYLQKLLEKNHIVVIQGDQ